MNFLNYNPFLRILMPFVAGIAAWLLGLTSFPDIISICITYSFCLVCFLTLAKRTYSFPKLLFALLAQVFLLLAGWSLSGLHYQKEHPVHYSHALSQEPALYSGYVSELPAERNKSIKAEVELQQVKAQGKWQHVSGKIIVYFEKSEAAKYIEAGNTILFSSVINEVQGPLNPHEFDYKNYLAMKNIFYTAYLKEGNWNVVPEREHASLYNFAQKIRKHLLSTYKESGMRESEFALVAALVLGYDDEIDQPLMNAYSHTGTLHVLSVSGLHVGVIYLMLGFLLSFMDHNKKLIWLKVVLILFSLWFFVLLSGFSAPAVRAAMMFSLILLGKTLFENVEVSNIVFVSAFLSLCYNPFWLADVGFQLSYTAVLGIIFLYPYFYNMFYFSSALLEKAWALCSVSLAAQLATLPITLYYFHQFPTLFLVTNIILIPVSTVVMYGGMLILLFSKITAVANLLVWLTGACIKFMNGAAIFFDQLPFCVIDNIHLSMLNMILMYVLIILVFVAIEKRSYRLLLGSFGLTIAMFCISLSLDMSAKKNQDLVIYHDKRSVMSVFDGTFHTNLTDTTLDRLAATVRENHIMRDMVGERSLNLGGAALIVAGNKKILYLRDGSKYSDQLVATVKPDHVWIPASGLKRRKQQKNLRDTEDLIVSGRLYKKDLLPSAYFTENKGAFVVSLRDEHPDRK